MFLQIHVYKDFLYWNSNYATQDSDVANEGIIYKHSIGTLEKIKTNFGGGIQLSYNFPKPSFTVIKEYLTEIVDKVNNVTYSGTQIDTDDKIMNILKQLA